MWPEDRFEKNCRGSYMPGSGVKSVNCLRYSNIKGFQVRDSQHWGEVYYLWKLTLTVL